MLRDPRAPGQRFDPLRTLPYTIPVPIDVDSLHVRTYPDPVLRRKAEPVGAVTDEVRQVAARMIDLMRQADGVGLAAPQVGLPWRLFVAEVPPGPDGSERTAESDPPTALIGAHVYINPEITTFEGDLISAEEGCLSLPDIVGEVRRSPVVELSALGPDAEPVAHRAGGLLARCLQHELDHLDGVLIIDRMTQMSRMKTRSALRDLERASRRL